MKRLPRSAITLIVAVLSVATLTVLAAPSASAQSVGAGGYNGPCSIALSRNQANPGATLTVTATGFNPGDVVPFTLDPGTVYLGSAVADSEGVATLDFVVPADQALGLYTVSTPCGVGVESTELTIVSSTGTGTGTLPRTGSDLTWLIQVGVLLVALGGAITLVLRKRSDHADVTG